MRLLAILLLLLISPLSQYAQQITDEGNRWFLNFSGIGGPPGFLAKKIEGDTMLQEIGQMVSYKKLYLQTNPENAWVNQSFVREDAGKVYIRFHFDEEGQLVYDFDLSVGDTFQYGISNDPVVPCELTVTEVDEFTTMDGVNRKRISLTDVGNADNYKWIEGVGSDYGLFDVPSCNFVTEYNEWINCLWNGDDLLYTISTVNEAEDCWWMTTGINEYNLEFEAFPNPTRDVIYLDSSESLQQYSLFDVSGKLWISKRIKDQSKPISLENYPKGKYFLVVENGDGNRGSIAVLKL